MEAARLHQAQVTTELRRQAKEAITGFINALPDRTGIEPWLCGVKDWCWSTGCCSS